VFNPTRHPIPTQPNPTQPNPTHGARIDYDYDYEHEHEHEYEYEHEHEHEHEHEQDRLAFFSCHSYISWSPPTRANPLLKNLRELGVLRGEPPRVIMPANAPRPYPPGELKRKDHETPGRPNT
jgi:hypothetical protein